MKRVAVLLSTFNGERYLPALLESLALQDFENFDLIVRDDCSTDETLTILKRFSERRPLRLISSDKNIGPARSFMELLDAAGGLYDWYMFADQDDWWGVDKISRCVRALSASEFSDVPALYCSTLQLVDESLEHVGFTKLPSSACRESALVENVATGCTIGINRLARLKVLTSLPEGYAMHDWWLYIVVTFFGKICFDPISSIKYRQHDANAVGAALSTAQDYKKKVMRFFKGLPRGVWSKSQQAEAFLKCYGSELDPQGRRLVNLLCESQKSVSRSIYLFLFSPFKREKKVDQIFQRLFFLIGRY